MKCRRVHLVLTILITGTIVSAQTIKIESTIKQVVPTPLVTTDEQTMWNTKELYQVPKVYPCPDILKDQETDQVKGIQFESVPLNGKPTKIFAWYGLPKGASSENPAPAMVLVHGGGGSAFKSWVERWLKRGYAAIAFCTSANFPLRNEKSPEKHKPWLRNPDGGPRGWGGFGQIDKPVKDQWTYHAVAAAVKAHSFLRSIPGVDKEKTGLTGISWGGYLSSIISAVDQRFQFAAPVYGCGFYGEGSLWRKLLLKMGDKGAKWVKLWDAARYTPFTTMPMLFCTGTNDKYFLIPAWLKTARTVKGPCFLCLKIRMPHGNPPSGDPPEIAVFANHILKGAPPLARITKQGRKNQMVWSEYECETPIVKVNLCFTKSSNPAWEKREWQHIPASFNPEKKRVTATLPAGTTSFHLNLIDKNGIIVSTEFEELKTQYKR